MNVLNHFLDHETLLFINGQACDIDSERSFNRLLLYIE